MTQPNRPQLKLEGNTSENFKNFELRFNDYCIQADYRDLTKDPNTATEREAHYKKPLLELAALRSALPDEALQVIRYTIEPQITADDKNKPWIWMTKLREHYTGSSGNSLMADRFQFWKIQQSPQESIQDWEVRIRQYESLCEYSAYYDEMCRDKFVFGLYDETIRTELLKSHIKADGTAKVLADVIRKARAYESAVKANKLIEETTKTDEQVNWARKKGTQPRQQEQQKSQHPQRRPHRLMKLKREPGTCYWCGDERGPHPWHMCPAYGVTCRKCGGNDHLAKVCLENTKSPIYNSTQERTQSRTRVINEVQMEDNESEDKYYYEQDIYDDDGESIGGHKYAISPHESKGKLRKTKAKRYFANLSLSSNGSQFKTIKLQIETAATCNTIAFKDFSTLPGRLQLKKSPFLLHPYGDSAPIRPVGQAEVVCERETKFYTVLFQVLPDSVMVGKPALLSGTDSIRLGLATVGADEIYHLCSLVDNNAPNECKPVPCPSTKPIQISPTRKLPVPGRLRMSDVLGQYKDVFQGLGCIGTPVTFKLDDTVTPINMPVHRVPISKRQKEKEALQRYEDAGILKKVTVTWCSNELIRETPKKFRICIDPSQTVNKAILRPVHQMPTLNEQLHRLYNAKCFSLVDAKDGFLQIPLDEASSFMTTMHTSYSRYRWLRL